MFRKKFEYGWFDVEFTMYGCAYLERSDGKMRYKISSHEEDIYDFIEDAAKNDIFPSRVETLTLKCPVPSGMKEQIAKDVKKELAKELQKKYQKDFFVELYKIADDVQNNSAKESLWQKVDELEGYFDEEQLQQFENMVEYCYSCRKLFKEEYNALMQWLKEERINMNDTTRSKDLFEKTFYGTACVQDGKMHYIINTQKGRIYREIHTAEEKRLPVMPIYKRIYGYNYTYKLTDATNDYKLALQEYCKAESTTEIMKLKNSDIELVGDYQEIIDRIQKQYSENAVLTLKRYLYHWGYIK
ncbi:MAG: hypothetical protein IJC12_01550 [Peptococcaceae bacterium]|nr:hypothetical protein [Peptococcaceae bacterium]